MFLFRERSVCFFHGLGWFFRFDLRCRQKGQLQRWKKHLRPGLPDPFWENPPNNVVGKKGNRWIKLDSDTGADHFKIAARSQEV